MAEVVALSEVRAERRAELVRRVVSRRIRVAVACNHPDNGMFRGRAPSIHVSIPRAGEVEFDYDDWDRGVRFRVTERQGVGVMTIARAAFPFVASHEWVGNWCWNEYVMKRFQGIRLLKHLASREDWTIVGGSARVIDWLERAILPPTQRATGDE